MKIVTGFLIILGFCVYFVQDRVLAQDVEEAYGIYKSKIYPKFLETSKGTPLSTISRVVAFTNWFKGQPGGTSDVILRILYEGLDGRGISKTRRPNLADLATMIALLKDAPLSPRKETSKEAHVIKHQRAIDRVIRALNSLNADSSIKEVLESTVWTVRQAGIPSNNPGDNFDKASIARGIGAISILYNILLTNPKTDRETIFRQHPEIRQCLTDFNARSSTLSNFPAPAVEKLFKVLSFETRLALIQASKLTWKWPNPAQKLTFTLTRAYKIRPTLEEVRKLKKKFPNINSVTFKHLRLDEGKDSKTIERILLIMSLWDIRHFCITDSSFYDFSVYAIFNNLSRNLESLMIKRNTWKGYSMDIPGSFVFDFSRNLKVLEFRENHWKDGKISDFLRHLTKG